MAHELPLVLPTKWSGDANSVFAEYFPLRANDLTETRVRVFVVGDRYMPGCMVNRPVAYIVLGPVEDGTALYYAGKSRASAHRIAKAEGAQVVTVEQYETPRV